jgi:hypothetical protein
VQLNSWQVQGNPFYKNLLMKAYGILLHFAPPVKVRMHFNDTNKDMKQIPSSEVDA